MAALNAPSGQSATTASGTQINLSWTRGTSGNAKDTVIFRSTSSTPPTLSGGTTYNAGTTYSGYYCLYRGSATSLSDTGLTPGTTYYYYFYAENWSYYSAGVSANATTWSAPSAPTITGITPGNGQLSVAFTAPASNGGAAISNYKYSTDNGSTWVTRSPAATGSPIVITGLNNGTTYTVRIRAVNSVGDGTQSGSSTGTPRTTPGAPTITGITPGNGQLSVAFTAPASNGGAAISNYEYSTNDGSTWTTRSPAATGSPIVITGLNNGTTYTVRIRAVNAAGVGTQSGSSTGTPRTTPGAPTITGITPGNGQLSVAFTAPASNGGAAISNYKYSTDNGSTWTTRSPAATTSPIVITGLNNGTAYTVKILAVNAAGDGTQSGSSTGTPRTTPTLAATPAASSIAATSATLGGNVTSDGGAAVTDHGVVYKTSAGVTISDNKTQIGSGIGSFSQSIGSLSVNTLYWHRSYAINPAGTTLGSEASFWTLANTPNAPTVAAVSPTSLSVTIAAGDGNPSGTTYAIREWTQELYVQANGTLGAAAVFQTAAAWGTRTVTGLNVNQEYGFRVVARNGASVWTGWSSQANKSTLANVPSAPTVATPSATTLNVTVNANGNPAATEFAIRTGGQYVQANGSLGASAVWQTAATWGTRTVTGLASGTTHSFDVKARNGGGTETAFSATASGLTICAAPATPTASAVGLTGFTASWSATTGAASYRMDVATDSGFSSILGSYNNLTVAGTSQAITGLTPGRTYYVRVRAVNASGTGANSDTLTQATTCFTTGPSAGAASLISDDRFTANWSAVTHATTYRLDVSTSATFTGGGSGGSESFESGLPTSYTATTSYDLGSGTWTGQANGIVRSDTGVQSGSYSCQIRSQTGAFIATPTLSGGVGNLTFYVRSSTASGSLQVNVSTDDGVNWSAAPGSPFTGLGTTTTEISIDINDASVNKIQFYRTAATITIDDVTWTAAGGSAYVDGYEDLDVGNVTSYEVTGLDDNTTYYYRVRAESDYCTSDNSQTQSVTTLTALAAEPTTQAHTVTFTSVGSGGMTINWSNGNGANRLVAVEAYDFSMPPEDGTTYSADPSLGGGDELADGGWVVYIGSGSSVTVSGLDPQTLYYVKIYEFNGSGGTENYLTSTASGNPASKYTLSTEPSTHGTLTATAASTSSIGLSWTAATGAGGYVIVRKAGSAPTTAIPVDGAAAYSVGNTIGDGTVVFVNTSGAAGSTTDSHGSMSAGTTYHYKIYPYAYNGTPAHLTYNYKTDGTPGADSATTWTTPTVTTATPADPSTPSDPQQATAGGNVTADGGATVSERGVVWALAANPTVSNNKVAHASGGTGAYTVTLTGLTPGQTIHYRAYAINTVGTVYGSSETFTAACFNTGPTVGSATSISTTGFTAHWTALAGATGYRLDVWVAGGATGPLASHNGTLGAAGWTESNWTQRSLGGDDYFSANNGAELVSPAMDFRAGTEQSLTFKARTYGSVSGDSPQLTVSISRDNGTTWTVLGTRTPATSTLTAMDAFDLSAYYGQQVRIKIASLQASPSVGIDDIEITHVACSYTDDYEDYAVAGGSTESQVVTGLDPGTTYLYRVRAVGAGTCVSPNSDVAPAALMAGEPTGQATTVAFSALGETSLGVSWANGNGANRLVIARAGSAPASGPVDATGYTADANFGGGGSALGSGKVVYIGDGNSFTLSGLSAQTRYYLQVYEFNGNEATANYLTTTASGNPGNRWTLSAVPSSHAGSFTATAASSSSINLSWTAASGADGYVILQRTGGNPTGTPNNGQAYTAGNTVGDSTVAAVVTGTSTTIGSLSASTTYYYSIIPYKWNSTSAQTYHYRTAATIPTANATTLAGAPSTQAHTVTFNTVGTTSMGVAWTSGNGAGRLVIARAGSAPSGGPVAGTTYTADVNFGGSGTALGSGKVVYIGTGNSFTLTGLSAATQYYLQVYEYNGSGGTINYNTSTPSGNPGNRFTLSTEPASNPNSLSFTAVSSTGMTINWGNVIGNALVVLRAGSYPASHPVDGTTYTASAAYGAGTGIGGGYSVYKGSGTSVTVSGLTGGVTYYVYVYNFNGSGGTENYRTTSPLQGTQLAASVPTLASPTATSIGQTAATLGATVSANGGLAITARGTVWGTVTAPTGNVLAEGGTAVSAFSHARSSLPQGTRIFYRGYAANAVGTAYSPEGSFFTEPGQASNVQFANVGFNTMRVSWTAGDNSDGTIVIVRAGNSTVDDPVDGTTHTANAAYGTPAAARGSSYVVYRGSGTQVDVTGLSGGTTYYVEVFAYKGTVGNSGVNQGINYRQTSPATGNQATLSCATIVTQPDVLYARGQGGSVNMTVVANNSDPNYAWRKRGAGWGSANGWSFTADGGGFFIGSSTANAGGSSGIDTSSKAWGLYNSSGTAEAVRSFPAMSSGDVFEIEMDNGWVTDGASAGTVGFGLQNASGNNVWEFFFTGGNSSYTVNAGTVSPAVNIPFTGNGLKITVTLTSSTAYSATIQALNGGSTYGPFTGNLLNPAGGQSITRFRGFNYRAGAGDNYNLYFNSMKVGPSIASYLYEDSAVWYDTTTGWTGNAGQGPLANGGRISGADTATLTITELETGDEGFYDVVVWNSCGSAVSPDNRGELTVAVPNYGMRDDAGVNLPTVFYWHTDLADPGRTEKGTDFDARNLGEIQALFIKGANIQTWKTAGGDVTGTKFQYKVWKTTDSEPGTWTERSVSHTSTDGGNQVWSDFGAEIDIAFGLDQGHTYKLKILFTVQGTGTIGKADDGPYEATFAIVAPSNPDDPASATATADGPQMVRLAWTKNAGGNNVMVVHRVGSAPTAPTDGTPYSVGQSVGSGIVIYKGAATSLEHVVAAGSANHYAFYSVSSANYYSDALDRSATTDPFGQGIIEPFAYTNGIALAGGNTGKDWSGAWSVGSGSWNIDANSGPEFANFTGYPAGSANRVKLGNPGNDSEGKASRNFSTINSGSIFVAFKVAYNWEGANKWAGLSLMDGATERAFFGKGYGGNWFTFAIGDGSTTYWSAADMRGQVEGADKYYLVVGKYDIANGRIHGQIYPSGSTFPETEPADWTVTQTGLTLGQVSGIRLGGGAGVGAGSVGDCWFDEIRIGTSWGDLIPATCPSWVGTSSRSPSGGVWLGDNIEFTVQSWPPGLGQTASLTMLWTDSTSSSSDLGWWKNELVGANIHTFWQGSAQMTKAGTHNFYHTVTGTGCGEGESTPSVGNTVVVSPLNNPSSPSATGGPNRIDLSWAKNAQNHDVIVLRRTSNTDWPSPVQGETYNATDLVDDATVVYRGGDTTFSDTGLASSQTYYYRFYSENWSYYSTGTVAANAATDEGDQTIVVDGNPNDWVGAPGTVLNSGTYSVNEYVWRDKAGEQRNDLAEHANSDIREFRVYADATDVYFLIKMAEITDVVHPYVAIGVDTRRSDSSSAMNWLGDDAGLFVGGDYSGNGAAPHFPEYNLIVHNTPDGVRVEAYHHEGGNWYRPDESAVAAMSTTHNAIEVRIPRSQLSLVGSTVGRFTVASLLNNSVWANEGDTSRQIAAETADAVDSVSIAPYNENDGNLALTAWQEDISDGDIDFWFDVHFGVAGLAVQPVPNTPGSLIPAPNGDAGASPLLSWGAVAGATSYLLEVDTSSTLNGVNGTENGEILIRVNLPADTTSYRLSTSEDEYFWRVRARNAAGMLSGGAINRFTISADKLDVEGPKPTLMYIGTDVEGFLDGDYDDHIERHGYIQSVTDAEIRNGTEFGFVLLWEDASGVYATNRTREGYAGGEGQFAFNIVAADGRVSPNWDVAWYNEGTFVDDLEIDDPFAQNQIYGYNHAPMLTTFVHNAFSILDYNENYEYYLTVSAEDGYSKGVWDPNGTWLSYQAESGGEYFSGWCADGPSPNRNVTTNFLIRINVTDDDRTPPQPATGAGFANQRSLQVADGATVFEATGTGQDVVYTITDEDIQNADLRLRFNVFDSYMGLAYGATPTRTGDNDTLHNTALSVTHWLTNNVSAFNQGMSTIVNGGRDTDNVLTWRWSGLTSDDVSRLWGDADLDASQGSLNRLTLHAYDMDDDRPGDQAGQDVHFGYLQVVDDDTEPPEVQAFTVEGLGMVGLDDGLSAGAIAIIGANGHPATGDGAGGGETFAFVVLSPFPEGTVIHFTDCGWAEPDAYGWHNILEFHKNSWVSTGSEAVGSIVSLRLDNINNDGDQVVVYQYDGAPETDPKDFPADCRFIYALNICSGWSNPPVQVGNQYSALYYGLTNAQTAVSLPAVTTVNVRYTGPRRGTASQLLEWISDKDNWSQSPATTDFADYGDAFEILGPGDMPWNTPLLTDAQINQGTYAVTGKVHDVTKGLQATGTAWAPPPHFALFNPDGTRVASNNFAGVTQGGNAEQTMSIGSFTGATFADIMLGEHEAILVVSDADNNRAGDHFVVTNQLTVHVVDDDPDPPRIGAAGISLKVGATTLAPVASADRLLIAGWNFNNSDLARNHGTTGILIDNFPDTQWFLGSTVNRVASDVAGQAFSPVGGVGTANNGNWFQFELDMTDHMALVMTFAAQKTTTGFNNNQVSWSIDGETFTDFGDPFDLPTSFALQTFDFSTVTELNDAPTAFIRITLRGATLAAGNNRYDNIQFKASPLDGTAFEMTDAHLAEVNASNPLRFEFNVYDPISGVARGATDDGINMAATVEGLFEEDTSRYDSGESTADSTDPLARSVWKYATEIPYEDRGTLFGDGETYRQVTATFADTDSDRPNDRSWVSNAFFTSLRIIDDDTNTPVVANIDYAGGSGRPFFVSTNSDTPAALTTTYDPVVRGSRRSGTGTNTIYTLSDAEMQNPAAHGIRFAVGAMDEYSGVARGTTGTTNSVMNISIGDIVTGNFEDFKPALSTSGNATNVAKTSVWGFGDGSWTGEQITEMVEGGNMRVTARIPDLDDDRPGDRATLEDSQVGYIKVVDNDIAPPLMPALNLSISSVHNLFMQGFETVHGWTNASSADGYVTRINDDGDDRWIANDMIAGSLVTGALPSQQNVVGLRNDGSENAWLQMPPRNDPGTLFVWVRLSSASVERLLRLEGRQADEDPWVAIGADQNVTSTDWVLLDFPIDRAGFWHLRLRRITGDGTPTIYLDDISLTKRLGWTNAASMGVSFDNATDYSGVHEYRHLQGEKPDWQSGANITEGTPLATNAATLSLAQGVVTGFVFAVDNDNNRPNDRLRSPGMPYVVKVDRTPPTGVPGLTASTDAVDDPSSQFDLVWTPDDVGPDKPGHIEHPGGTDNALFSPWATYKVYYGPYDAMAVPVGEMAAKNHIWNNYISSGIYSNSPLWTNVTAATPIEDPGAAAHQPDYQALTNAGHGSIRLYDLDFDQDYVVVVVGVDEAGNEGEPDISGWYTNNTIRFAVTSGWTIAKSVAMDKFPTKTHAFTKTPADKVSALGWIAAGPTNVQGHYTQVTKEYDLITWDAPRFDEQRDTTWDRVETVRTNWFVDDGGLLRGRGQMRFYRASYKDRWQRQNPHTGQPQRPLASEEVYALHNVILSSGQNFVALHGVPFENTFRAVFGGTNVFPGGSTASPETGSTIVEFYSHGTNALSSDKYWLSDQNIWQKVGQGGDVSDTPQTNGFFNRGFSIHLPPADNARFTDHYATMEAEEFDTAGTLPAMIWSPILQVPTNHFSQVIHCGNRGRPAVRMYNLAALRMPVAAHPREMNLIESGFVPGHADQSDLIYTVDTSRKKVLDGTHIYCDTNGVWRFVTNNGPVPNNYFKPNDVMVIISRNGGGGNTWTWTYHPTDFYDLPTRWVEPMDVPTTHSSNLTFVGVSANQMLLRWWRGDGRRRVVVARQGAPVSYIPQDGMPPLGVNANFALAPDKDGGGHKLVYNDSGDRFQLRGLTSGQTYHFRVYEYNGLGEDVRYLTNGIPLTTNWTTP